MLRFTYGLVPIVAGADKFFHLLTDWNQYLAPFIADRIPAGTFMSIVGIIEIIAGILVLAKPRIGSVVVALWLLGIAVNLVLTGKYFDIAVRDTVMAIGAWCLHLLWQEHPEGAAYREHVS
ncbi:tRNA (5-methylaminomethyl-2-thiouridylate)-methyltransferase [Flaviaesturariibacter flavus]|uniref:tRNA (5-methylaminomethyl-2-thiouridylate)-methyltransferase n=1 Tax=Flaviaesturariibacter flavus TaxID=2502780 RepID=A0A4V2NVH2_9BACT|nr:tRNA (5-methylaminomethyl-2-thiouridylate)-methyltransferase [Flaviaesturariibacter flavus]